MGAGAKPRFESAQPRACAGLVGRFSFPLFPARGSSGGSGSGSEASSKLLVRLHFFGGSTSRKFQQIEAGLDGSLYELLTNFVNSDT